MAETKVFHNITSDIFSCAKRKYAESWAKYDPPDADRGKVTITVEGHPFSTPSIFELDFDFVPAAGDLTYTLIRVIKQGDFSVEAAWYVFEQVIDSCRGQGKQE